MSFTVRAVAKGCPCGVLYRYFADNVGVAARVVWERRGIGVIKMEGDVRVEPLRKFFESHALDFGYKCVQRPFLHQNYSGKV